MLPGSFSELNGVGFLPTIGVYFLVQEFSEV